jgi:hypothetical protein
MDALDIEKWRFVSHRYVFICFCVSLMRSTSSLLVEILFSTSLKLGYVTAVLKPPSLCWPLCLAFDLVSLFHSPGTSVAVSSILLGLLMVGRAAFVFPLSFLSNLTKKSPNEKISFKQQVLNHSYCYYFLFCNIISSLSINRLIYLVT